MAEVLVHMLLHTAARPCLEWTLYFVCCASSQTFHILSQTFCNLFRPCLNQFGHINSAVIPSAATCCTDWLYDSLACNDIKLYWNLVSAKSLFSGLNISRLKKSASHTVFMDTKTIFFLFLNQAVNMFNFGTKLNISHAGQWLTFGDTAQWSVGEMQLKITSCFGSDVR